MMNGLGDHGWGMGFGMGWWWIIGIVLLVLIVWLVSRTANRGKSR
jgi:putative membrane protein